MDINISEVNYRTKLEKRLFAELMLTKYQLEQLKQQSRKTLNETEQIKKLLTRKPKALLLDR